MPDTCRTVQRVHIVHQRGICIPRPGPCHQVGRVTDGQAIHECIGLAVVYRRGAQLLSAQISSRSMPVRRREAFTDTNLLALKTFLLYVNSNIHSHSETTLSRLERCPASFSSECKDTYTWYRCGHENVNHFCESTSPRYGQEELTIAV
jgi:hypothetical protein